MSHMQDNSIFFYRCFLILFCSKTDNLGFFFRLKLPGSISWFLLVEYFSKQTNYLQLTSDKLFTLLYQQNWFLFKDINFEVKKYYFLWEHIKTKPSASQACLKKKAALFPTCISIDCFFFTTYYASIVNITNRLTKKCTQFIS